MSQLLGGFSQLIGGYICGGVCAVLLLSWTHGSVVNIYHTAKDSCEVELPRNQVCEMMFLPKQKGIQE